MDTTILTSKLDTAELEQKVKHMYSEVARNPHGKYHFEMGRALAERLGYEKEVLDKIPSGSIDSFAGVGYFFDISNLREGEKVLDLGSGSGMDTFIAALMVGKSGKVKGIDMTPEQLQNAKQYAADNKFENVEFVSGRIEELPFENESFDAVISNGVINLCPDKEKVFREIHRVLKPGGRMVIADIVAEHQMPETITCDTTLWASCIGGAGQEDAYKQNIDKTGLEVLFVRNNNAYEFISKSAKSATREYGVKSICLFAQKNEQIHFDKELNALGLACINLTPEIKKAMTDLQPAEIIKVFSDDPASRAGVPAWCRLTGHTLLATKEISADDTFYFIQKRS